MDAMSRSLESFTTEWVNPLHPNWELKPFPEPTIKKPDNWYDIWMEGLR
jgi:hypothetical protein